MQKSQVLLVGAAVALLVILFAFGRTVPRSEKKPMSSGAPMKGGQDVEPIAFSELLETAKGKIPAEKLLQVNTIETNVVRGDVKTQQIAAYHQLYNTWDSLNQLPVAAYYLGEAAKLENSEKSLTFAANLFLAHLQHAEDPRVAKWEAQQAITLFDQAIQLNPANDTLKISQAMVYMNTGEPMTGVAKLREVVAAHPDNIDAQVTLANLAITSGQYDKAIERLEGVAKSHPDNAKVLFVLAESYRSKGDKKKAIELFEKSKQLMTDPELKKEVDSYIKSIQ
ncbi:tetratricopeptide repeat protein [Chitinophaga arvensicola]|uniref:Tetratricopeptide repeat-containing protein n=1 Tax=Chitinophaga arvensicola TaxID=29529 RepID=A0A1I0NXZ4_9BACT|nr:tetratricopeptide repeat protein [Chitinophaga arvensicola]SEW06606.1 Tetratricopeptide repeat-containing protein [Chitinophaga arvensicola]